MSNIIAARRSPVVPRGGALTALEPHEIAAPVIRQLLTDAGLAPEQVGEVIVSNALGAGGNIARSVTLAAGLPAKVPGLSLDRQCVGGLDALLLAKAMIQSGHHDVVIAGGVESYSRRPLRQRTFADGRPPETYDQARFTPWVDRDPDMAAAADALAELLGITRSAQDDWAMQSHAKALAATKLPEIVPIEGLAKDPFARNLSPALCRRAASVSGNTTAANMSVAADAAGFVMMVSDKLTQSLQRPTLKVTHGGTAGGDPTLPGLAPVEIGTQILLRGGLRPSQLNSAEIMEAFAVQAIACQQGMDIPEDLVNLQGGSLARGHPIGASGAVLAVRLFHQLATTGGHGFAAIAAAGGLGTAVLFSA